VISHHISNRPTAKGGIDMRIEGVNSLADTNKLIQNVKSLNYLVPIPIAKFQNVSILSEIKSKSINDVNILEKSMDVNNNQGSVLEMSHENEGIVDMNKSVTQYSKKKSEIKISQKNVIQQNIPEGQIDILDSIKNNPDDIKSQIINTSKQQSGVDKLDKWHEKSENKSLKVINLKKDIDARNILNAENGNGNLEHREIKIEEESIQMIQDTSKSPKQHVQSSTETKPNNVKQNMEENDIKAIRRDILSLNLSNNNKTSLTTTNSTYKRDKRDIDINDSELYRECDKNDTKLESLESESYLNGDLIILNNKQDVDNFLSISEAIKHGVVESLDKTHIKSASELLLDEVLESELKSNNFNKQNIDFNNIMKSPLLYNNKRK